ncbi:basic proline-rich protein-like isoform X2 [Lytechinus variegatus]|uniref:basic proline-rich protein-like isoform X2 n=1 Tax=Lytechinus variegatus TaxID=7654 RepID=UPI001BB19EAD|nr:basic proline-rich protein-like isoform X2 [Lytechinus variegatus]
MASVAVARDISLIFIFVLSIIVTISGLPVGDVNVGNTDGQIEQPDGQQTFPADVPPPPGAFNDPGSEPGILPPNNLPETPPEDVGAPLNAVKDVTSPEEAAAAAGTGLAMMAGPVVPGGNTGALFPNIAPPPGGEVNVEAPAQGQEAPANNGAFFNNMAPPPVNAANGAGEVNIEAPAQGQEAPANNGAFFNNMAPPPVDAANGAVPAQGQMEPADNGGMFPANMPPPPPGAMNDGVPGQGQTVPGMFPANMPPPPPGAMNEGVPAQENKVNAPSDKGFASPPYQGMFPPNMPPPPPGAFNEPPPNPIINEKKASQVAPSSGSAVEPVYIKGMAVPEKAAVPPSDPNRYVDPNNIQASSILSNQPGSTTGTDQSNDQQYNPDTPVSNDQSQAPSNPQVFNPDSQDNNGEGVAPYNPDEPDASNIPSQNGNGGSVESTQNQNEAQVPYNPDQPEAPQNSPFSGNQQEKPIPTQNEVGAPDDQNVPEADPNQPAEPDSENNVPTGPDFYESPSDPDENESAESPYEPSDESPYEDGEQVGESQGEYSSFDSVMNFLKSSDYESSDSLAGGDGSPDSFWQDSDSEEFSDTDYGVDSSDYSNLDWLYDDNSYQESDSSEEKEDQEDRDQFTVPQEFDDDLYRSGGAKLIIYCIPALILCVLILLAWNNYRGKIRVVGVPTVDSKQYDWRTGPKSEEHAPMLTEQDLDERGY